MNAGIIKDPLLKTGFLTYFAVSSVAGAAEAGGNAALTAMQGASTLDPNTWENSGYAAGAAVGSVAQLGADAAFLHNAATRYGGKQAWLHNGKLGFDMNDVPDGAIKGVYNPKKRAAFTLSTFKKNTPYGFMKNWGFARGLGLGLGIPMAAALAAPTVLGFAGKILDEAWQSSRRMKELKYDDRFFDTSRYDASTYQQVGMGMQQYGNKLVSLSRVYHSR